MFVAPLCSSHPPRGVRHSPFSVARYRADPMAGAGSAAAAAYGGGAGAAAAVPVPGPGVPAVAAHAGPGVVGVALAPAHLAGMINPAQGRIAALDQRRRDLTNQRRQVVKEMKYEKKKEQRLVVKTRNIITLLCGASFLL